MDCHGCGITVTIRCQSSQCNKGLVQMNSCKSKPLYSKTRLTGYILMLFIKLMRSTFLNVVIFILGFCCGFVYLGSAVHHHAYQNRDYESLTRIKQYLQDQRDIDIHIDEEVRKLEHKMSHDEYKACERFPGVLIRSR